jgi:hypothetical protein
VTTRFMTFVITSGEIDGKPTQLITQTEFTGW